MKQIEVDDAVYRHLLRHVENFEDTPNSVLIRILGIDEGFADPVMVESTVLETEVEPSPLSRMKDVSVSTSDVVRRTRARSRDILPIDAYEGPILRVLDDLGGEAKSREVLDGVELAMRSTFKPKDCDQLNSGVTRWKYRAQMSRVNLGQNGLIDNDAPKGTWKLTELGRARATTIKEGEDVMT